MPRKPTGRPPGRPVGSGAVLERDQVRLTVRIPQTLFDRLEAYAEGLHFTRGTPELAGCVRQALEHFLACPSSRQTQTTPNTLETVSQQTETIQEALETLSQPTQTVLATTSEAESLEDMPLYYSDVDQDEPQPPGQEPNAIPDYDAAKYALGLLCKHGHEHGTTGKSLRRLKDNECLACQRVRKVESRQRKKAAPGA